MKFQYIVLLLSLLFFPGSSFCADGGPPTYPHGEGNKGPSSCVAPPCCESASECCGRGAPVWSVNMVNMNLYASDTPIWYSTAIGPSMYARLSYNSEAEISGHELFGNKWIFRYNAFLEDNSDTITVTMPTGRQIVYSPDGEGGYNQPYKVNTPLVKITGNHFELRFLSGEVYVFSHYSTTRQKTYLTEIRDNRGQTLSLGYDVNDRLSTITDAQNRVTTLLFNAQNLVRRINDPFGRFAIFEYDGSNNLTTITDMGGYSTQLEYDADSSLSALINSAGQTLFNTEPADDTGVSDNYPAPGADMQKSHRITVTLPNGAKEEYYYNGFGGYSWHVSANEYVEYVDVNENNYTHAEKTVVHFTNSSKGLSEEISSIIYPSGQKKIFGIDYDSGRITSLSNAEGHSFSYTYNDNGKIETITTPNDETITYVYDVTGVDLKQIQSNLGTIEYDYNEYHELTSTQDHYDHETSYDYNIYGQVTKITDPLDIETIYTFNTDHLLEQISRSGQVLTSITYDSIGRLETVTDSTDLTTIYDYNNLDNIIKITNSDGKNTNLEYNSGASPHLITSITDRSGRVTTREYNAVQQLIRHIAPDGGVSRYIYDSNGNLLQFIDLNSNVTSYTYNKGNQLIKKTYPDGKSLSFSFNSRGLVERRTNARGIRTYYFYDELNNLVGKVYSDMTPSVTIIYDNFSRPVTIKNETRTYTLNYNNISQLLSVDGPLVNDTVTYSYDANGRRTNVTAQNGQQLTYVFDELNRLTKIDADGAEYLYAYPNEKTPLVQSLTRPNGSVTSYSYDDLNRLLEISNNNSTDDIISKHIYTYNSRDLRGSEEIINTPLPIGFTDGITSFQHNEVNQLTSSANPNQLFTYDKDGNMNTGYTPEGYLFTAKYDAEDRLASLEYTDSGSVIHKRIYTYRWDNFISRIQKYENSTLTSDTQIVRDHHLALQDRDNSTNTVLREYIWGPNMGGGIGGLLNLRQYGSDYSFLYDGKGNITTILDNSQATVAQYSYNAFGGLMGESVLLNQPFRFSTKRYDSGTGLYYYGYRFYNPNVERWMNRDPLGEVGGINLYNFVSNDPVNWVDPWGLMTAGDVIRWAPVVLPIAPALPALAGTGALGAGAAVGAGIIFYPSNLGDGTLHDPIKASFPPGYWDAVKGAEEWGRRKGIGKDQGRGKFHDVKGDCKGSRAKEDYGVNPDTGDVVDGAGDWVGNLND